MSNECCAAPSPCPLPEGEGFVVERLVRHERLSISSERAMLSPITVPVTRLERWLLALVCAVTLSFAVITPPFQAPDEISII